MIRAALTVDVCRGDGGTGRDGLTMDPCFAWITLGALTVDVGGADGAAPAFGAGGVAATTSGAKTSTLRSNVRRSLPDIEPIPTIWRATSSPFWCGS